jgi:acyl-CoA synthetase (AMP-forming)/AMP-acid ligase II
MPATADYAVAYLALAKLGAVTAGLNPYLSAPERAAVLDRLAPDVVLEAIAGASAQLLPREPLVERADRDVVVVFTSGSTGVPKGATFQEHQLRAIVEMDVGGLDVWGTGGAMLTGTQLPHVGFMTKLPWYLRTGATLLLQSRWRAETTLRLVEQHRLASIGGVSAQIGLLLCHPDLDRTDVSTVQTLIVGGGPSPVELVHEARERFGAGYSIRYSSTESGGCGTGTAFDADDAEYATVGRPRAGIDVRIDPADDEVLLRSPSMMSRYWRDPERTSAAFTADGWLRTGDLGALDADSGLLRLIGRTTDMYIRGGYNVHPQEVEAVLIEHPAIAQVAIGARPDPVMGELGVAVVVVKAGVAPPTVDDLRAFAADRLATYKLPEAVLVVDELPITTMDKLDRRALAALVGG